MPFRFTRLEIPEVILIEPRAFDDDRGFFMETYKESEFAANGIPDRFVQDNYSRSSRGVLRGLHYQKAPAAQGKLVGVVRGRVFDVAVDLRRGSPTYGKWVGAFLSDKDHRLLYIPEGFAHGFQVASQRADVLYKVTHEYAQAHDRGIAWDDPEIGILWPTRPPVLSAKDASHPRLAKADHNFAY